MRDLSPIPMNDGACDVFALGLTCSPGGLAKTLFTVRWTAKRNVTGELSRGWRRRQPREALADTLLQCRRALFRVRDEADSALRLPPFLRGLDE
jgi:hypothetical protein